MIKVYKGTEIKISVSIDPIDNMHMADYDFEVALYVSGGQQVKKTKQECIKVDNDTYIVTLNTNALGKTGKLLLKVTANIPDNDFEDKLRTEVSCIDTDIMVLKEM